MHTPLRQVPLQQLPLPEQAAPAGNLHCPPQQTLGDTQATQIAPPVPHLVFIVPCRQVLPSQQPEQLPGPHKLTQLPLEHVVPAGQLTQVTPLLPQAALVLPGLQVFKSAEQQPFGQLVAVHTHDPF